MLKWLVVPAPLFYSLFVQVTAKSGLACAKEKGSTVWCYCPITIRREHKELPMEMNQ